ncbi:coatomer subunit beta, partial [Tilletia horrida]
MPQEALAYTIVAPLEDGVDLPSQDLRSLLQKADDDIRYVLPSKSKQLKKMLHFYWEICPKLDDQGKLKQEMIVVCNAIRNDFQHPNQYIRGPTLRFLQKHNEALMADAPELIETFLAAESDATCRRNAFTLLCEVAPEKAVEYLMGVYDQITTVDELMQLAVIDFIRKDCKPDSPHK